MLDFDYIRILCDEVEEGIRKEFREHIKYYDKHGFFGLFQHLVRSERSRPDEGRIGLLFTVAMHTMFLAEFEASGKQVYRVGPAMGTLLSNTEVDTVRAEDIHSPYRCFYVDLPRLLQEKWALAGRHPDEKLNLEGMYCINLSEMGEEFTRKFTGDELPAAKYGKGLLIFMVGRTVHAGEPIIQRRRLWIQDPQNVEKSVTEAFSFSDIEKDDDRSREISLRIEMVRFVINLYTYLTSPDVQVSEVASPPSSEKIEALRARVRGIRPSKAHYEKYATRLRKALTHPHIVGVNPTLEEDLAKKAAAKGRSVEEFLRVEHTVGGHKQRYHYGPRDGEQEVRWKWKIGYVRCSTGDEPSTEFARSHYEIQE